MKIIKELPTFVWRTYRGGALLREFLRCDNKDDSFYPEDWISSFTAAKNPNPVESEGITKVLAEDKEDIITNLVKKEDFGKGRNESGVLIKFLDSAERLGIQVHPTKEYAKKHFGSDFGKTECWHILGTRSIDGQKPCVYLGFKEYVTKKMWKECFESQDIEKMLSMLHKFEVEVGDTILVTGGTPHAIGAGCFMLEIQEPSDYTMRTEKVTLAGEKLTPQQIHYGVGEENMLDCFNYTPTTKEETYNKFFLNQKNSGSTLISYNDTTCFALEKTLGEPRTFECEDCLTVIFLEDKGKLETENTVINALRGDKFFVPANEKFTLSGAKALICYQPKRRD